MATLLEDDGWDSFIRAFPDPNKINNVLVAQLPMNHGLPDDQLQSCYQTSNPCQKIM